MQPAIQRTTTSWGVLLLALFAIPMMPRSADAAVDTFMIVDQVPGPSTSRQGAIDLLAFSVSFPAPGTSTGTGTSSDTAQAAPQSCQIAVTKLVDKSTVQLWNATITPRYFKTIEILMFAPPPLSQPIYDLMLQNAYFTNITDSGTSTQPTETVTIKASRAALTIRSISSTGVLEAPETTTTFACK